MAAIKKTLLDYEEKIKGSLSASERADLESQKKAHDVIQERGKEELGKKEESGYISIPPPSLTEMREQLRRHLREAKKEERLRGRSIMIRVSPKIVREKNSKKSENGAGGSTLLPRKHTGSLKKWMGEQILFWES